LFVRLHALFSFKCWLAREPRSGEVERQEEVVVVSTASARKLIIRIAAVADTRILHHRHVRHRLRNLSLLGLSILANMPTSPDDFTRIPYELRRAAEKEERS
jgi:hypothetical protein